MLSAIVSNHLLKGDQMNKKLFFLPLMIYTTQVQPFFSSSNFMQSFDQHMKEMDTFFDSMRNEMQSMREHMNTKWGVAKEPQPTASVTINDSSDDKLVIEISGLRFAKEEDPQIKANVEFDENDTPTHLVITANGTTIRLEYAKDYRFLSVGMKQEIKEETKDEDGKKSQRMMVGSMQQGKTLGLDIALDKPTIDYNREKEILSISIPTIVPEAKGKEITVNIK